MTEQEVALVGLRHAADIVRELGPTSASVTAGISTLAGVMIDCVDGPDDPKLAKFYEVIARRLPELTTALLALHAAVE
jgi:hypothetical protein